MTQGRIIKDRKGLSVLGMYLSEQHPRVLLTQKSRSTRGLIKSATRLVIKRTLYMHIETDRRQLIDSILGFCN